MEKGRERWACHERERKEPQLADVLGQDWLA